MTFLLKATAKKNNTAGPLNSSIVNPRYPCLRFRRGPAPKPQRENFNGQRIPQTEMFGVQPSQFNCFEE
jgi:hypothetical protein